MKIGASVARTPQPSDSRLSSHQHLCEGCGETWMHSEPNCPQQPFVMDCTLCTATWRGIANET